MDLQLAGKHALITGGASGIGLATARAFAAEGAHVTLWDLSPQVTQVARELERDFPEISVHSVRIDLLDFECLTRELESLPSQLKRIDCIVHGAAIGSGKFGFPFTNLSPSDWTKTIEVNVLGLTNLAHAVVPRLMEQDVDGSGCRASIVVLASVAGQIGSPTDPPYSASKAANINFAQCMAKDLAAHGIRVNSVCPGMVQTKLNRSVWQSWHDQTPESERLSYEEWGKKKIENVVPLKRWQSPEDIADMILFISSSRARQVTGQTLNVDGGFVMHW